MVLSSDWALSTEVKLPWQWHLRMICMRIYTQTWGSLAKYCIISKSRERKGDFCIQSEKIRLERRVFSIFFLKSLFLHSNVSPFWDASSRKRMRRTNESNGREKIEFTFRARSTRNGSSDFPDRLLKKNFHLKKQD